MNPHTLDAILAAGSAREWPGPSRNPRFEEFLMHESRKPTRISPRRLALLIALGVAGVTGAVYGTVRLYESYLVHLTVNGEATEVNAQPGQDGTALLTVPMPGGGRASILVGPENIGPDGKIHVEIRSDPGNLDQSEPPSPEPGQPPATPAVAPGGAPLEHR